LTTKSDLELFSPVTSSDEDITIFRGYYCKYQLAERPVRQGIICETSGKRASQTSKQKHNRAKHFGWHWLFKTKLNASTDHVPLVVTYNPALLNLHKILNDHQHNLQTSSKCQRIFKETPLVAYRTGRSFSQMLTNKRLPPSNTSDPNDSNDHSSWPIDSNILNPCETKCRICGRSFKANRNLKIHFSHKHKQQTPTQYHTSGFWPCGADRRCAGRTTYGHFTQTVTSTTTGEKITLQQRTTCQTSNVIYLTECSKCNNQCIGETGNSIHRRANQHRSDINAGHKNIPTIRHLKNCGVKYLKLTVIEKVRNPN